jgi:crotonobetainyl-CoA:carnitine CoA-transferase CaiB-like acyl-CoA transferase
MRGVKVVDFSIALTGPYPAALMADQGADVIKVERPGIGDLARWVGVAINGMSALYFTCNRGKRSIVLNLHDAEGAKIALDMCADADVVIQNYRPGVMDRLGLGYEQIRAINPNVIYVSLTGFGSVGPYRDRSAYDTAMQAYAGLAMNQADPTDGVPVFLRQTAADKVTALYAAQAIAAALFARERGDGGQHVELAMADAVVSFLWADAAGNEVLMDSDGSMNSSFVAGFQPMKFIDGWGIVTPTSDADFAGMCKALDVDGWDDPRATTMAKRREFREFTSEIMDMVYAKAANLTQAEASARFDAHRLPYSMILSAEQIINNEHAIAMGMFVERDHHIVGRTRMPRHPAQFAGTPALLADGAPGLGQHTDEILTDLGLADRIAAFREQGTVA